MILRGEHLKTVVEQIPMIDPPRKPGRVGGDRRADVAVEHQFDELAKGLLEDFDLDARHVPGDLASGATRRLDDTHGVSPIFSGARSLRWYSRAIERTELPR